MGRRDPSREAKWRETIASWEGSGQTIKAFCQEEGTGEGAFHYWRRELRRRDGRDGRPRHRARKRSVEVGKRFVQLEVATVASSPIRIHVASDLTIDVPATLDRQTLSEVFAAARMAASC